MNDEAVSFLDDARWNPERECVEVTARLRLSDRERHVPCAVTREALESLVQTGSTLDPLRLFSDFEPRLSRAAAQRFDARLPEIALTARDLRR
jgi:hypothetical protein